MCAALRIPIDVDRLLTTDDPLYVAWVRAVVESTARLLQDAHEQTPTPSS